MLVGHSLVYFAPEPWDGLWRNRQQLMSVLARRNKVLFAEPRLHFRPTVAGFRTGRLGVYDLRRPAIRQISDSLFVFRYPVWAPISGRSPLRQFTRTARRISIRTALSRLHMSDPIVWFSRPSMVDLIDEIPTASLRLYHVVDEYTAYSAVTPARREQTARLERKMAASVDAVIVVSEKLYQAKRPLNEHTYLVPNAVDYAAYSTALADPRLPDDLERITPPRLGYIGLIGDKLDLGMLTGLAGQHPDWSLVFLGQVRLAAQADTWQTLEALPNVHHLGPVGVSQVPHYVKGFQVGLMPYLQNCHAEHISPLKLYDYLAAGVPVASMDIPAAREFGTYVHLADTPGEFARAVRTALADSAPERYHARRTAAAQHTWEARVAQLSALIEDRLDAKRAA